MSETERVLIKDFSAIDASQRVRDPIRFQDQCEHLCGELQAWINTHAEKVDRAYMTFKHGELWFIVIKIGRYENDFEDELTDLDIRVANDPSFDLLEMNVLALPQVSDASVRDFVGTL